MTGVTAGSEAEVITSGHSMEVGSAMFSTGVPTGISAVLVDPQPASMTHNITLANAEESPARRITEVCGRVFRRFPMRCRKHPDTVSRKAI
jgi:hypothetical protein